MPAQQSETNRFPGKLAGGIKTPGPAGYMRAGDSNQKANFPLEVTVPVSPCSAGGIHACSHLSFLSPLAGAGWIAGLTRCPLQPFGTQEKPGAQHLVSVEGALRSGQGSHQGTLVTRNGPHPCHDRIHGVGPPSSLEHSA